MLKTLLHWAKKTVFFSMEAEYSRLLGALAERRRVRTLPPGTPLEEVEFRVFSQWGEDGILQHLIGNVHPQHGVFVEFGAAKYLEANTRYLLLNDNWSGVVFDGSHRNIAFIRSDPFYWRHELTARQAFVTAENIDSLILESVERLGHAAGDVALLSIDIDGNDYWIWNAIVSIQPKIVVCEYNGNFGPRAAVTVPYRPDFERFKAHYSGQYAGASLAALVSLGERKGYVFVGSNSAGNNAFFLRKDCAAGFRALSSEEGFRPPRFREARTKKGQLSLLNTAERSALLSGMPVVDVDTGEHSHFVP